jgi:hypothetical protein
LICPLLLEELLVSDFDFAVLRHQTTLTVLSESGLFAPLIPGPSVSSDRHPNWSSP